MGALLALRAKSHPTLCIPMDCSPPGSSVHGILQARILEWVVAPSSRGSSQCRDCTCVSYISCVSSQVCSLPLVPPEKPFACIVNPWDSAGKNTRVSCQLLLQGDLPDSGIESGSPTLQADSFPPEPAGKPCIILNQIHTTLKRRWSLPL